MKAWIELPVEREPGDPLPRGLQHCDGDVVRVRLRTSPVLARWATYSDGPNGQCYRDVLGDEPLDVVAVWGDPTSDMSGRTDPDREPEGDE
jgi:hypothetical protein